MAFDGVAVSCIVNELNTLLSGGRVDKINQPEFDEINLLIRSQGKNHRLIASASSSTPRVHITDSQKENPDKAPMFCMLLRKHLAGGKVVSVVQPDFERVIEILIEGKDELGDISVKRLVVEIMGRHSNIILVSAEGKILGSIKHVDFSVSAVRQLLPGMIYEYPPRQDKVNPMTVVQDDIYNLLKDADTAADKFILDNFTGIGPLTAREIAFGAFGDTNLLTSVMDDNEKQKFARYIYKAFSDINNKVYKPCLLYKGEKVWDFSAIDILQYCGAVKIESFDSLNSGVDTFYSTKDKKERLSQKSAQLVKFIETNIARCVKKLALQKQKLKDCENKEQYKIYGDLLTANIHRIQEKSTFIEVENYYDECKIIRIELKPELSPSQNAQRYYTLYQKCKNAEIMTAQQIELATIEQTYLESVLDELSRAENERDINEIRDELALQGYGVKKSQKSNFKKKQAVSKPMEFELSGGYILYVGKNNMQNDELTLKMARNSDLWFHTKNIHGSHGVIKTNGVMPNDDIIVEAAKIVAYYSKARDSANVPVDYTIIKNVKKPKGAKPGMVIYDNYNTVNVKPVSVAKQ